MEILVKYVQTCHLRIHSCEQLSLLLRFVCSTRGKVEKTGVINDPLGLTKNQKLFSFAWFWKVGTDGRTDGRTYGRHVWKHWLLPAVIVGWPSGSKRISILLSITLLVFSHWFSHGIFIMSPIMSLGARQQIESVLWVNYHWSIES